MSVVPRLLYSLAATWLRQQCGCWTTYVCMQLYVQCQFAQHLLLFALYALPCVLVPMQHDPEVTVQHDALGSPPCPFVATSVAICLHFVCV